MRFKQLEDVRKVDGASYSPEDLAPALASRAACMLRLGIREPAPPRISAQPLTPSRTVGLEASKPTILEALESMAKQQPRAWQTHGQLMDHLVRLGYELTASLPAELSLALRELLAADCLWLAAQGERRARRYWLGDPPPPAETEPDLGLDETPAPF